jgi:hypothetical protein
MPWRTVDVLAAAAPSLDPYAPGASAWALASGFVARGADVRVLHPPGDANDTVLAGAQSVPVPLPLRRPGAAVEPAEFAAAAGRFVRRTAELVVRDPLGLGGLGLGRTPAGSPLVAGFVRSVELVGFDRDRSPASARGVGARLDLWRDRRAVRRLERIALEEADRLFYDAPDVPGLLAHEYAVPSQRLAPAPPPVLASDGVPSRAAARTTLRLPPDVPIVAAPAASPDAAAAGIDRCAEAFRRVRPFFPGARLVIVGCPAPTDAGVVSVPARDRASIAGVLAAADVALFLPRVPAFDPGVVLALRAGCVVVRAPAAQLPLDPGPIVRTLASDDAAESASLLAELLADPALRRTAAEGAAAYAARFDPERVTEGIESALGRRAG